MLSGWCRVLQRVAACCSVLQCAVCAPALQQPRGSAAGEGAQVARVEEQIAVRELCDARLVRAARTIPSHRPER